jgi:MerR family transcriptional regulator, light-induced transcriptional regulator
MPAPGASWMPIRELSRRIGVSPDLLRKWESRYAVLTPIRTSGNQRLYSQVDEARARLMLRHVGDGMPPAQAAELAIAARFRIKPGVAPTAPATLDKTARARTTLQTALERYDETTAEHALEQLLTTLTATAVISDVLLPYLHGIGERWASTHLSVAQEHFASAFIHSRLLGLARGWDRGLGPRAVLACPPDEQHTFGLIAFGIALHQTGWRITYLGADTPIPMIAEATASVQARLTVITAAMPGRLERVLPELRAQTARWNLALGGAGVSKELADRCDALHLPNNPISAADFVFA